LPSRGIKQADGTPTFPFPKEHQDAPKQPVLAVRTVGYPDKSGVERALELTLFVPVNTDHETWQCAFTFGASLDTPVRHGLGADAIEAFLDALAGARNVFEAVVPIGWEGSGNLLDCADFPYKTGRSYRTD